MSSWYQPFSEWVERGECFVLRSGIQPFGQTIDQEFFYPCLWEFFEKTSQDYERDIIFSEETN